MGQVILFVLAVLLANSGVYAECASINVGCNGLLDCKGGCSLENCEESNPIYPCLNEDYYKGITFEMSNTAYRYCKTTGAHWNQLWCSTIELEATCCTEPISSSSVASSSSQGGPPIPPPETCTYCEDYMGWAEEEGAIGSINIQVPYSRMYRCKNCTKDANGYIISAFDCQEERNSPGTCSQNGDCPSNQICADSTGNDSPVQCIATFGHEVWMKDIKTGNTFKCSADGSCERAKQMVASGECKNPYADKNKPNSSDSNDPNSSSAENPPESSGEFCDMCDKLDRIAANTQATMNNTSDISQWTQETMNKTIDIDNHLTEIGIDVSHIRTNTEETATNTGSIDNKLNTTNSLLNDIKNKNWNPQINVNPPTVNVGGDTIIVNVGGDSLNINVDTAKAPAEILGFLKGVFGDSTNDYNASDTAGTGTRENDLIAHLDSQVNGGVPDMRDSIPHAVTGVKGALTGLKDSINNGPYGDSLAVWQNQLLNNGVITGSGSNDCPAPLRRSFSWNFGPKIGTVQLGSLRFICEDALGLGFSLWTLARTLLRAMVAICCMLWIYREVTGTGGGSNDED